MQTTRIPKHKSPNPGINRINASKKSKRRLMNKVDMRNNFSLTGLIYIKVVEKF